MPKFKVYVRNELNTKGFNIIEIDADVVNYDKVGNLAFGRRRPGIISPENPNGDPIVEVFRAFRDYASWETIPESTVSH